MSDDKAMREQVAQQADQIAAMLKIAPEEVMFDRDGVQLTPTQGEQLLSLALVGYSQIHHYRYISSARLASCVNCGQRIVGNRQSRWVHMATGEYNCADDDLNERGLDSSGNYFAMPSQKGVLLPDVLNDPKADSATRTLIDTLNNADKETTD